MNKLREKIEKILEHEHSRSLCLHEIMQVFESYVESKRQRLRTPDGHVMQSELVSVESLLSGLKGDSYE